MTHIEMEQYARLSYLVQRVMDKHLDRLKPDRVGKHKLSRKDMVAIINRVIDVLEDDVDEPPYIIDRAITHTVLLSDYLSIEKVIAKHEEDDGSN